MTTLRQAIGAAAKRLHKAKLVYGHGTTNPIDEAAFLATEGLGVKKLEQQLKPAQLARLQTLIDERIRTRKPAPYIVKCAYIQGYRFRVDERVLVPRSFIGELLFADHVVGPNAAFIPQPRKVRQVLDLCTGSGCLAILAAQIFPNAQIDAVDLSTDALALARQNVADYKLGKRITLHQGDLFTPLKDRRYDIILTNPPYVTSASMRRLPPEYRHEPRLALAAGSDGLDLVRTIVSHAPRYLTPHGAMLCEIGAARKALERAFPKVPFFWLETALSSDEVFWVTHDDLLAGLGSQ